MPEDDIPRLELLSRLIERSETALKSLEQQHGADSLHVARELEELAKLLKDSTRPDDAEKVSARAKIIREKKAAQAVDANNQGSSPPPPVILKDLAQVEGLDNSDQEASTSISEGDRVPCPFCAELILIAAIKCRYCGEKLTGETNRVPNPPDRATDMATRLSVPLSSPQQGNNSSTSSQGKRPNLTRSPFFSDDRYFIFFYPCVMIVLLGIAMVPWPAGGSSVVMLVLLFIFSAFFYFYPTITAFVKKKKNTGAIFVVNFCLGWTLVGWVVALSWALVHEKD